MTYASFDKDPILALVRLAIKRATANSEARYAEYARLAEKESRKFFLWRFTINEPDSLLRVYCEITKMLMIERLIANCDSNQVQVSCTDYAIIVNWAGTNASLSGNGEVG